MLRRVSRTLLGRRWCTQQQQQREEQSSVEDDWVVIGHSDRALPFEPSLHHGEDVVRAETELYRLYRQVEEGEVDWIEFIELFATCDQELTATAFMWCMYLKIIPTLFGVKREYSRLFHYHHEYDIRVLNVMLIRLLEHGSTLEAFRVYDKNILATNKRLTIPTTHTMNIILESARVYCPMEEEWWLDRGILFVESKKTHTGFFRRRYLNNVHPEKITPNIQLALIKKTFEYAIHRHDVKPDFTTLYLMSRLCPVDIDIGRQYAAMICMYMETLKDSEVPLEARLIISEYLHWKMENIEVNPALAQMQGPALSMSEKLLIFADDCVQALTYPFKEDKTQILEGKRIGKNTVQLDIPGK